EITLLVAGTEEGEREPVANDELVDRAVEKLLAAGLTPKQVRKLIADIFELPRQTAYSRVLAAAEGAREDAEEQE
ncbi:MAG TPA: hypothetical protein VIJ26_16930, partial [Thermoanaerobaculia bacterium]